MPRNRSNRGIKKGGKFTPGDGPSALFQDDYQYDQGLHESGSAVSSVGGDGVDPRKLQLEDYNRRHGIF